MRSRWFHTPILHTEHGHEKKVSWLELFYDLIFVAGIIQLGDALSDGVARGEGLFAFAKFAGHMVPLWIAWTGFTFYANRFVVDDFLHRILVFVQMFAVGAMAIAAPEAMGPESQPRFFALAYVVAQAMVSVMYLRAHRQVPDARPYCAYWGGVFAGGALAFLASVFLPAPLDYAAWGVGILLVLFAPTSRQSRTLTERFPLDLEHLSERYGLLTIIVLGESFVKVLSYLAASDKGLDVEYLAKGFFNLLITCSLWWVYFDDVAGSKIRTARGSWVVWLYAHVPLAIAITAVGVAVKIAIKLDLDSPPDPKYAWLLAGTLALTLFSVAVIDSVTERRNAELSDRARINLRVFSGLLLLVLGQVGTRMTGATYLAVIAAVLLGQVLFDMAMAPLEQAEHVEGTAWKELAKRRIAGDRTTPRSAGALAAVVRKGAPAELRRDLYFFFIEGSWTRMIVALVFCYVLVNVFFAGLYLIEPASIGAESPAAFDVAFAFSVQTFSTIGYGSITPKTPYGDMLVTIEAAVGILGAAIATGLMFAKASRPRSSVLFSRNMVVTTRHGQKTLMFRAGNARGNEVVEASIAVSALIEDISPEGHHIRSVRDLELVRNRSPIFTLSWTVMHVIDEKSPLYPIDLHDPKGLVSIIVTMLAHDATYATTTHARHLYGAEDIRCESRFVDVISELEDGRMLVDYTRFHDTVPDDAPELS